MPANYGKDVLLLDVTEQLYSRKDECGSFSGFNIKMSTIDTEQRVHAQALAVVAQAGWPP